MNCLLPCKVFVTQEKQKAKYPASITGCKRQPRGCGCDKGAVAMGPRVGDSHHIRASRKQRYLLPGAGNTDGVSEAAEGFSWS